MFYQLLNMFRKFKNHYLVDSAIQLSTGFRMFAPSFRQVLNLTQKLCSLVPLNVNDCVPIVQHDNIFCVL